MRALFLCLCPAAAFVGPLAPKLGHASRARGAPAFSLRHDLAGARMAASTGEPQIGQFGFPEPGPMPLVTERDACGVGFIADRKGRRRHETIARALHALDCMEHRGGCGGDSVSGDGAGVLTSIPWELYEADGALKGKPSESIGVAQLFLPQDEADAQASMALLEGQVKAQGFELLTWRDPPQDKEKLGPLALEALPTIRQAFVHHPTLRGDELEEALYQLRRSTQADVLAAGGKVKEWTYFASFSSRTIVHKGMVMSCILGPFYGDLTNELFQTNFAIYHRRFSTNTVPKWPLAQPMRCLAHNGEINTLIGNVNWQRALDIKRQRRDPLCSLDRSDSANLDAVFENFIIAGKSPAHSLSMLVPEAYRQQPVRRPRRRRGRGGQAHTRPHPRRGQREFFFSLSHARARAHGRWPCWAPTRDPVVLRRLPRFRSIPPPRASRARPRVRPHPTSCARARVRPHPTSCARVAPPRRPRRPLAGL